MNTTMLAIIVAVVATVVVAGGVIGYNALVNQQPAQPTASPNQSSAPTGTTGTPEPTSATPAPTTPTGQGSFTPEGARDAVFAYITVNHTEVSSLLTGLSWTGGSTSENKYVYTSGNWKAEVTYENQWGEQYRKYQIYASYTDPTTHEIIVEWGGFFQPDLTVFESAWGHSTG